MTEEYTAPIACLAGDITYRQLDYWDRVGLVVPSIREAKGSGSRRLYSREDIIRLATIRALLDAGINVFGHGDLDVLLASGQSELGDAVTLHLNMAVITSAVDERLAILLADNPDVPVLHRDIA